jgi:hypothetical protein
MNLTQIFQFAKLRREGSRQEVVKGKKAFDGTQTTDLRRNGSGEHIASNRKTQQIFNVPPRVWDCSSQKIIMDFNVDNVLNLSPLRR